METEKFGWYCLSAYYIELFYTKVWLRLIEVGVRYNMIDTYWVWAVERLYDFFKQRSIEYHDVGDIIHYKR